MQIKFDDCLIPGVFEFLEDNDSTSFSTYVCDGRKIKRWKRIEREFWQMQEEIDKLEIIDGK